MLEAGISAAAELFSRPGEPHMYSIWRRSEYVVDFPVAEILRELNRAEGLNQSNGVAWGGSENVGGSPRGVGSALTPHEVEAVINRVVELHRRRFRRSWKLP